MRRELKNIKWAKLAAYMQSLSERESQILEWACRDGLTVHQIAEQTKTDKRWMLDGFEPGIAPGTVRATIERALARVAIDMLQ